MKRTKPVVAGLGIAWLLIASPWINSACSQDAPSGFPTKGIAAADPTTTDHSTDEAAVPQRDLVETARRILQEQCFACHGESKSESGLRLDRSELAQRGGDRGSWINRQSLADSLLLKTIDGSDPELAMPPEKPLNPLQVDTLRRWIEQGAPWWDETPETSDVRPTGDAWTDSKNPIAQKFGRERIDLWSLRPIQRPSLPAVRQMEWTYNSIDCFLLSEWEKQGRQPASDAPLRSLARRAVYDVTGVPPTHDQVVALESSHATEALEIEIDRLLASPQHGEHLARMWLDVVRYSDSNGFDWDEFRPQAWRYRDYVIRSFNSDTPFDQFITEQMAGDELVANNPQSQQDLDRWIATGYLRLGPHDNAAGLFNEQERSRHELLSDLTETTGSAFLGLTLSCCRCHDHKTDPLTQQDHYRLRAFFSGVQFGDDIGLQVESDRIALEQANAPIALQIAEIDKQLMDPANEHQKPKKELESEKKKLEGQLQKPPTGLLMTDDRNQLAPTHVLYQGDHQAKREEVLPGFPSVFTPQPAEIHLSLNPKTSGRRLTLARWMTSPDNPWTARIIVNRLWQHYFGQGLVATPNDFGISGERPNHPELLDWLASELIQNQWSLRHIERLILTSHAYRMRVDPSSTTDPSSKIVSIRKSMKRLSAEQLRDAVLASSGLLQNRMGGPPIWPALPEEVLQANPAFLDDNETKTKGWYPSPKELQTVRTIYLVQKRTVRIPILETFDLPENSTSCARRDCSIVAPQALSLLNSEWISEAAIALAERSQRAAQANSNNPSVLETQIRLLFEWVFQREADPDELQASIQFATQHSVEALARAMLNANEFTFIE